MTIEITNPDVEALILEYMQAGSIHTLEDLIRSALQPSPDEESLTPTSPSERLKPTGRKSLVDVFAPLRGLDLDFSRTQSASRTVDLG